MHANLARALEFDRIRDALAAEASTPLGRARALALEPATAAGEVAARLRLTTAAVTYESAGGSLGLDAADNLEDSLALVASSDEPLPPLMLLGLARFLDSTGAVSASVKRAGAAGLLDIAGRMAIFAQETAAIHRAILPGGDISDAASPALRDIRESLRRQRARLRSTLERLTQESAKYLQDQIVTDRHGRYVVVLRAEHRGAIPGLVHGTSGSGASLYLEPLATVELNNDVVALTEKEQAEIHRILSSLSNALRRRQDELDATVDAAAELDELHAKSRLASRLGAVAPILDDTGGIEFLGARHPLLVLRGEPTPSDLVLRRPANALVISGPNTGGKTVALKAFGLLAMMAQAGIFIPVEPDSRLTPFRSIFADIGDEQSIAASLSTFSAHVANLVAMERALDPPSLILLDEVGGGTDPAEGGALGAAVIEHFRRRGAFVVATTHDDALKSYAATTDGVIGAGFGFDPDTYAPTYRLRYGAPGRSLALEIAERLGMPAAVIADARGRRSGRESQLAAHLALVDQQLALIDRDRQAIARDREALQAERSALLDRESRLAEREAVLKKRLDAKLTDQIRSARAEVDAVVTRLRQKADALATSAAARAQAPGAALSTGDLGGLRREARSALDAIERTHDPGVSDADRPLETAPAVGDRVFVASIGTDAVVKSVSARDVEVDVRGKRMRVRLRDLRAGAGRPAGPAKTPDRSPRPGGGGVMISRAASPAAAAELVLIGATVDDAIDRAEKFLDAAMLSDERRLRIVHGHGTGRLRDALRQFFRQHPLIAAVEPAPASEGGDGATIVELKE